MRRGTRVGQAYVAMTIDGDGSNEKIVDEVEKAGPGIQKAGEDHGDKLGDSMGKGLFARLKKNKVAERISAEIGNRMGNDKSVGDGLDKSFDDNTLRRIGDRVGAGIGGHVVAALIEAIDGSLDGGDNPLAELFARLDNAAGDGVSGNRKPARKGDRIGDLFGAGARNNAINLFGRTLGGVFNLIENVQKAGTKMFAIFAEGFGNAGEGAGNLLKTLSGFRALGGAALGGLAKAGPTIVILIALLSAFASALSAVIALITAMASTIASALVGSLAVLGSLLTSVAAGAALVALAFASMTEAQKAAFKEGFLAPIKAELTGIGQLVLGGLTESTRGFQTWSQNIQLALAPLAGVAGAIGAAFGNAGNILTAAFAGPGFQLFIQQIGVYLPKVIPALATALGGFLNGTLALFSAILPYVLQFSNYLAGVATRFSNFANSAKGQNAIADFVARAVVSLQYLWNATREIFGFIGDLLFSREAQAAGNTIFDGIAKAFANLREILAKAIADGSLARWFASAIDFGAALWAVMSALTEVFIALVNAGVLDAVSAGLRGFAGFLKLCARLVTPLVEGLGSLSFAFGGLFSIMNKLFGLGGRKKTALNILELPKFDFKGPDLGKTRAKIADFLKGIGTDALGKTTVEDGGTMTNPYQAWAESLVKDGPTIAATISNAILSVNKQVANAVRDATRSKDPAAVRTNFENLSETIKTAAESTVNTAEQALNAAATTLAGTSGDRNSPAVKKALEKVKKAQKDVEAALKNQQRIDALAKFINKQGVLTQTNVQRLLAGLSTQNATLADFAEARNRIAEKIEKANAKLTEAINLRDSYKTQIADSIKAFGALTTAQAQSINGVEQALTSNDIVSNLQTRLEKIRDFQSNLRILLAQGLSNAAYKQLLDAGVEEGSQFASALVAGGAGAVGQINALTSQIDGVANSLGIQASNRLYQAGVDAAKGLVDGLNSQSAQLDAAATRLGNAIANAVKRSLGIKSPSTVMMAIMDDVGDGGVQGLRNQEGKIGTAASALASKIAVSPQAAVDANNRARDEGVSGNSGDPRFRDLIVQTPTEDPEAVAMEVLNEVTGALT